MANEQTWQKDTRPIEERCAERMAAVEARFRDAHEKGETFYHIDPQFVKGPVAAIPNSKGVRNPFRGVNAVILMQETLDKGFSDERWIAFSALRDHPELNAIIKKGQKGTVLIKHHPKTKEPSGLVTYFNIEQLATRDRSKPPIQETIQPAGPSNFRNATARAMAAYLKENIAPDQPLFPQFIEASNQAYETVKAQNQRFAEKRIAAIDAVNLRAKAENLDMRLMQEAKKIRKNDPEAKNFMYQATVALLVEGQYKEADIVQALNRVSPTPTGLNFDKEYGARTVAAAKEDPAYRRHKIFAASR